MALKNKVLKIQNKHFFTTQSITLSQNKQRKNKMFEKKYFYSIRNRKRIALKHSDYQ